MLAKDPNQHQLYMDLSYLCARSGVDSLCFTNINRLQPSDTVAVLSKKLALSRLYLRRDSARAAKLISEILETRSIQPQFVRIVLDDIQEFNTYNIDTLVATWQRSNNQLSSGQKFGYAYILSRKSDWAKAEQILVELLDDYADDPNIYRELGRIYFFQRRKIECFRNAERAVELSRRNKDLANIAHTLGNLATVTMAWDGSRSMVRALLSEALSYGRQAGDVDAISWNLYRLAELKARAGAYSDALKLLKEASNLSWSQRSPHKARVASLQGFILLQLGRYAEAREHLEDAVEISNQFPDEPVNVQSKVYLAQALLQHGSLDDALRVAEEALASAQHRGYRDDALSIHNLIGIIHQRSGRFGVAISEFKKSLEIARDIDSSARQAEALSHLGFIQLCVNNWRLANEYFSLSINASSVSKDTITIASDLVGIGKIYAHFGKHLRAMYYYTQALGMASASEIAKHRSKIYVALATSALAINDTSSFQKYVNLAVQESNDASVRFSAACMAGYIHTHKGELDSAASAFAKAGRLLTQSASAVSGWSLNYGKALLYWKEGRMSQAERQFKIAISSIEDQRASLISAYDRGSFITDKLAVFESFSSFLDQQRRTAEAVDVSERARARSLVDLIFTTQRARGGFDSDLEQKAIETVSIMRSREVEGHGLRGVHREAPTLHPRDIADWIEEDLDFVESELRTNSPEYSFSPVSTEQVQRHLSPNEVIIVYDIRTSAPEDLAKSAIYVVSTTGVSSTNISISDFELEQYVMAFRSKITQVAPRAEWEEIARILYRELIEPVRRNLPTETTHINIVPEGILHYLPFGALLDTDYNFLVEEFSISIAPSLTLLDISKSKNPMEWDSMVLFGDPSEDLIGAAHEIATISESSKVPTTTFIGKEVTLDNVMESAGKYDIIHFATHGRFISTNPLYSYLKLYDGNLTVDKIGGMQLAAYLVTLSACESGLGGGTVRQIPPGEEFIGLYQAFLAAGTPTVLASLWSISDRFSGPIMKRFYINLSTENKAVALAHAQRSFLAETQTRHPYYWASFIVIGDPR